MYVHAHASTQLPNSETLREKTQEAYDLFFVSSLFTESKVKVLFLSLGKCYNDVSNAW